MEHASFSGITRRLSEVSLAKLVVLFGAGASFGAGGIHPSKPPLGNKLFHNMAQGYPRSWGSLPRDAKVLFEDQGFEAGMEWVWRKMPRAPQILHKDLGHFFCRFHIADADGNAYVSFIRLLAKRSAETIMLATLNYEMVLEEAISIGGLSWNYGDILSEGNRILVVKPHGSCNFIPRGVQVQNRSGHVVFDTGVVADSRLNVLCRRQALAYCSEQKKALGPAIVAFMRGKPTRVCPTALKDMQAAFQTAVMAAETVAIVGVNPHVPDRHIWDCLARTSARLVLCGDEEAFENWTENCRSGRPVHYVGPYFADAVGELAALVG